MSAAGMEPRTRVTAAEMARPLPAEADPAPCPIVELRQYTLHDEQRDTLIDLFERQFIEPQEALGMKVIGTFRDLDRPNFFVWLRGFTDMDSRVSGLTDFYGGEVWKTHRETANATMLDSDNVLLLRAPDMAAAFKASPARPALGEYLPAGLIVATIFYFDSQADRAAALFNEKVKPELEKSGTPVLAWFATETAPNNYPRLPVREGEKALVWFTRFEDAAAHVRHSARLADAQSALLPLSARSPEELRLAPTARSELR
jgi:hypothetical protein